MPSLSGHRVSNESPISAVQSCALGSSKTPPLPAPRVLGMLTPLQRPSMRRPGSSTVLQRAQSTVPQATGCGPSKDSSGSPSKEALDHLGDCLRWERHKHYSNARGRTGLFHEAVGRWFVEHVSAREGAAVLEDELKNYPDLDPRTQRRDLWDRIVAFFGLEARVKHAPAFPSQSPASCPPPPQRAKRIIVQPSPAAAYRVSLPRLSGQARQAPTAAPSTQPPLPQEGGPWGHSRMVVGVGGVTAHSGPEAGAERKEAEGTEAEQRRRVAASSAAQMRASGHRGGSAGAAQPTRQPPLQPTQRARGSPLRYAWPPPPPQPPQPNLPQPQLQPPRPQLPRPPQTLQPQPQPQPQQSQLRPCQAPQQPGVQQRPPQPQLPAKPPELPLHPQGDAPPREPLFSISSLHPAERAKLTPKFFVFDLETNGWVGQPITELAYKALGEVDGEWQPGEERSTLIHLGLDRLKDWQWSRKAQNLTGISLDMCRDASLPSWREAFLEFQAFVEARCGPHDMPVLVAHNGKQFDLLLLADNCHRGAVPPLQIPARWHFLDTLLLARKLGLQPARQGDLLERYGIPAGRAHRALGDVQGLAALLPRLEEEALQRNEPGHLEAYPALRDLLQSPLLDQGPSWAGNISHLVDKSGRGLAGTAGAGLRSGIELPADKQPPKKAGRAAGGRTKQRKAPNPVAPDALQQGGGPTAAAAAAGAAAAQSAASSALRQTVVEHPPAAVRPPAPPQLQAAEQAAAPQRAPPRGILQGIASFVFGDGDPNTQRDARKWEKVSQCIAARGGKVTALQLAPYLDPSIQQLEEGDEGYMGPTLERFGGFSETGPSGQRLYHFPSLQRAAQQAVLPEVDLEQHWRLSSAGKRLQALVAGLGICQGAGVLYLTQLFSEPGFSAVLQEAGAGWVVTAFPLLQVYAVGFIAIPLLRTLANARRNAGIEARNEARRRALRQLATPHPALRQHLRDPTKMAAAAVNRSEE